MSIDMTQFNQLGVITAKVIGVAEHSYRLVDVNRPKVVMNIKDELADSLRVQMKDGSASEGIEEGKVYDFYGSVDPVATGDGNYVYMLQALDCKEGEMPTIDWGAPRMAFAPNARQKTLGAEQTERGAASATPAPAVSEDAAL